MVEPDICSNRHRGNANSFLANLRAAKRKPGQRERIYIELETNGRATCEELSLRLNLRYTSCSARLSELKAMRWVCESGEIRKTSGGDDASVIRHITESEREALLKPRTPYTGRQKELFQ